jgi:hypothetical protein
VHAHIKVLLHALEYKREGAQLWRMNPSYEGAVLEQPIVKCICVLLCGKNQKKCMPYYIKENGGRP